MPSDYYYPTSKNAVQKTLASQLLNTATTGDAITFTDVDGVQNKPGVLVINRVDSNGTATPSSREYISFSSTSGNTVIIETRNVDGSASAKTHAVGSIVEFVSDAVWAQRVIDQQLVEHTATGTHGDVTATSLSTTGAVTATQISTPANPSSGRNKLYFKSDDLPYALTSGGAEYVIGGSSSLSRQAIINGNFDVWQRGTTVAVSGAGAQSGYLADRYRYVFNYDGGTLPTITQTRQAHTPGDEDGSQFFYRVNSNGTGAGIGANSNGIIYQKIENGTRKLADGKKITVSFRAKSDVSGRKIGIFIVQDYGSGGSPTTAEEIIGTNFSLTTSWATYSHTFTTNTNAGKTFGTNNDDSIRVDIGYCWGSTKATAYGDTVANALQSMSVDVDWLQVNSGSTALPFQPKSFEEELRACQRYYEKSYLYTVSPGTSTTNGTTLQSCGINNTGGFISMYVPYKVTKRTSATTTIYDVVGTVNKLSSIAANGTEVNGVAYGAVVSVDTSFYLYYTAAATSGLRFHWTAEAEL